MGQLKYTNGASSFWLGDLDNDTFKDENNRLDYTKLASIQRAIANFVNIVTGMQIPVEFQRFDTSYTDGKTVVIGTKLDGKNFDSEVGLALHEGSHIAHTDFQLLQNFGANVRMHGVDPNFDLTVDQEEIIKSLLNWVEDRRIDYIIYTKAPGYRMYYESMYDKYFNDRVIDKALVSGIKNKETIEDYFFHIINFTNPNRNLNQLELLKEIWNIVDLKNISRLKSTNDSLDVACNIFKKLKDHLNIDNQQTNNSDVGNCDTTNSNTQPGQSGCESANDTLTDDDIQDLVDNADIDNVDIKNINDDIQLTDRQQKLLDNALERQKDFLGGNPKRSGRLSKQQANMMSVFKEAGTETVPVDLGIEIVDTIIINKLTRNIVNELPEIFSSGREEDHIFEGIRLGKILGRKLKARNESRTLKHTRLVTGKIDRRLISQLGYDNTNVFHRIVTDQYKDYFIHISIDASGSMWGIKFKNALTSAIAIAQAASMTTGIRVQISTRGTSYIGGNRNEKATTVMAYDSAVDKMVKIKRMFKYLTTYGCTPEGVSFKSIEKKLAVNNRGVESIFINYSDGYPTHCGKGSGDPQTYTKNIIKRFRESGMGIISYFIASGSKDLTTFKYMYGSDAVNIDPKNMLQVANTMNTKFLEKS
jgi:hypothetical protein